ncbi:MAG: cyclic pyranopterin monophosphate synthase MoaC [Deltaproteobacteria bacterium]|nr:cyclic pyranopterin monophosphate synthase MoaC [Deltaproteobacteria bacterium]
MAEFTHFDKSGRARMVDVSEKPATSRAATARGSILMERETLKLIKEGGIKKGDVFGVAQVAAVMAAKKTPDLIPMCHPIAISGVEVAFDCGATEKGRASIGVNATVRCVGPTGVEMEALTAAAAALLTIYDMCKAVDKAMSITGIELVEK